jgi:hypothetical protein
MIRGRTLEALRPGRWRRRSDARSVREGPGWRGPPPRRRAAVAAVQTRPALISVSRQRVLARRPRRQDPRPTRSAQPAFRVLFETALRQSKHTRAPFEGGSALPVWISPCRMAAIVFPLRIVAPRKKRGAHLSISLQHTSEGPEVLYRLFQRPAARLLGAHVGRGAEHDRPARPRQLPSR